MNASTIINDNMSLEEKLQAISDAIEQAQQTANADAAARGGVAVPVDPASLTICNGCE